MLETLTMPSRLLDGERGVVADVEDLLVLELVAQAELGVVADGEAEAEIAAGVALD